MNYKWSQIAKQFEKEEHRQIIQGRERDQRWWLPGHKKVHDIYRTMNEWILLNSENLEFFLIICTHLPKDRVNPGRSPIITRREDWMKPRGPKLCHKLSYLLLSLLLRACSSFPSHLLSPKTPLSPFPINMAFKPQL